jgi:predicted nucleic-acid-binding protein
MKALDTNILVRFLTGDDSAALVRVESLLRTAEEHNETFRVTDLVLLELLWVLRSSYQLDRSKILDAIEALFNAAALSFQSTESVSQFLVIGRATNFDLADILIGLNAKQQGCETTHTLDKKAAQSEFFEEI